MNHKFKKALPNLFDFWFENDIIQKYKTHKEDNVFWFFSIENALKAGSDEKELCLIGKAGFFIRETNFEKFKYELIPNTLNNDKIYSYLSKYNKEALFIDLSTANKVLKKEVNKDKASQKISETINNMYHMFFNSDLFKKLNSYVKRELLLKTNNYKLKENEENNEICNFYLNINEQPIFTNKISEKGSLVVEGSFYRNKSSFSFTVYYKINNDLLTETFNRND